MSALFFKKNINMMFQNCLSEAVVMGILRVNSFHASGDFCRLLRIFVNSLDADQEQKSKGPDLDQNFLSLKVFLKEFLEDLILMTTKV